MQETQKYSVYKCLQRQTTDVISANFVKNMYFGLKKYVYAWEIILESFRNQSLL